MVERLTNLESQMVAKGWCQAGELMAHVKTTASGYEVPPVLEEWTGDMIRWGMDLGREFKDAHKPAKVS